MIYILTGAIRSGKTSALLDWSKTRNDVDGLLCPDNEDGKRYFLKVKSKKEFELETESESEDVIRIGHFKFLKSAFKESNDYLISIASEAENKYLIIDEIGKLELRNEGLHRSAEALISRFKRDNSQHVILVVRDYLLDAVLKHYAISEYKILTKEDLELLGKT
ncbi:nucleoside-triphosphatase [Lacinutrix sp. MEBiC02595]